MRYRHDDNDLVRSARQQEFLREARQELPAAEIAADFNELKSIPEKYVTMDIRKETDLITLAKLFLDARSAPVRPGPLPGQPRRAHRLVRDRLPGGDP